MTWFLNREDAEALLATVVQHPGYSYTVVFNGCGPGGYGIAVHDPDGILITESYSPGDIIPLHQPQTPATTEDEYRELLIKAKALGAHTDDNRSC